MSLLTRYRITKFNPQKRNAQGAYLDRSEWTSISDIRSPAYRIITYEEYANTENAYVNTIELILKEKSTACLFVANVEMYSTAADFEEMKSAGRLRSLSIDFQDLKGLENSVSLSGIELEKAVRLILREVIWLKLYSKDVEVEFGYDYYMYIKCVALLPSTIAQIENTGLYVEPTIVDNTRNKIS